MHIGAHAHVAGETTGDALDVRSCDPPCPPPGLLYASPIRMACGTDGGESTLARLHVVETQRERRLIDA